MPSNPTPTRRDTSGSFDRLVRILRLRITREEREAAHKLEAAGKRFCVDFGLRDCGRNVEPWRTKRRPSRHLTAEAKWLRLRRWLRAMAADMRVPYSEQDAACDVLAEMSRLSRARRRR